MTRKFEEVLKGKNCAPPPIWLMRQAGRYLPEYRATRALAKNFVDFCLTPELATEATLQPIRRYDFDAAILFADILLIPHALGQKLWFAEGEGPKLAPLTDFAELLDRPLGAALDPVYETLRRVRADLADDKSLIGFCGGPWTVLCYMLQGGGSKDDFAKAREFAALQPELFQKLLTHVAAVSADYLSRQIEAGADVVKIFDSWAGLSGAGFANFVIAPTRQMVAMLRQKHGAVPIIGFPRGVSVEDYESYARQTGVSALALDQHVPLVVAQKLQQILPVQGNLDPALLREGGAALRAGVDDLRAVLGRGAWIFNLGHGVTPDVPPAHVAALVAMLREGKT